MNRKTLELYIAENYGVVPDFPWAKYPEYAVYRHNSNKKWFAIVMQIAREKLGPRGGVVDIVNFKCDTQKLGSLLLQRGLFPAYHMNKRHWITVTLDGTVADDVMTMLIDTSFALTAPLHGKIKYGGN